MLRKAFHHETISYSRKTDNEFVEFKNHNPVVALSDIPNQVGGLNSLAEDCLFNRFMFYAFKSEQLWKDITPFFNSVNLTVHFERLVEQVYEAMRFLFQYRTDALLSGKQREQLNTTFDNRLYEIATFTAEEAGSIVNRLELILYRYGHAFAALYEAGKGDLKVEQDCTDEYFQTGKSW